MAAGEESGQEKGGRGVQPRRDRHDARNPKTRDDGRAVFLRDGRTIRGGLRRTVCWRDGRTGGRAGLVTERAPGGASRAGQPSMALLSSADFDRNRRDVWMRNFENKRN